MQKLPDEITRIFTVFKKANYEIYLVGGAVRDIIMGRSVNDWDFTTNATPEQIQSLFPDSFYNNAFGTVGIPPEDPLFDPHEITTFRTEQGYSDFRRPDAVNWGKTLEEDLSRRDFTINALALSQEDNTETIIDPFNGSDDIKRKLVRAVGDPTERFREDALRLIRAVRIATQLSFQIEEETLNAIKSHAPLIHKIAKERIHDELMKIMGAENPVHGVELLRETGLLEEILPELEKTFGVEQKSPQRHHKHDVGTHLLMSLKECKSTDPIVRFATLIHDIGKPQTFKKQDNGVITFYNHEVVGSRIANNITKRLRFSKSDSEKIFKLVRFHQFTVDEHQTDSAIRRFIKNIGLENVSDMLTLRVADRLGGGARETSWRLEEFKERLVEVQKEPFAIKDLKINGTDVMEILHLEPGKEVGEILSKLFNKVIEKKIENDRETLLQEVHKLKG
mgnify:CR=1 FL=1